MEDSGIVVHFPGKARDFSQLSRPTLGAKPSPVPSVLNGRGRILWA